MGRLKLAAVGENCYGSFRRREQRSSAPISSYRVEGAATAPNSFRTGILSVTVIGVPFGAGGTVDRSQAG